MKDYFAILGLPHRFFVDLEELRSIYVARSRAVHPDMHTQGLQGAKEKSEELSGLNNQAYATLKDFELRVAHLLALEGLLPEEGQAELPQDFLMDMMDLHEEMMDEDTPSDSVGMKGRIEEWENALLEEARPVMESYDRGAASDLQAVRLYYLKNRYLKRLAENLQAKGTSL